MSRIAGEKAKGRERAQHNEKFWDNWTEEDGGNVPEHKLAGLTAQSLPSRGASFAQTKKP